MSSDVRRLTPRRGFSRFPAPANVRAVSDATCWVSHDGLRVISDAVLETLSGSDEKGWQWLLSVTRSGGAPTDDDMLRVLRAFEMPAFDEVRGGAGKRHLWCPVDVDDRGPCTNELLEQPWRWSA